MAELVNGIYPIIHNKFISVSNYSRLELSGNFCIIEFVCTANTHCALATLFIRNIDDILYKYEGIGVQPFFVYKKEENGKLVIYIKTNASLVHLYNFKSKANTKISYSNIKESEIPSDAEEVHVS